MSEAHYLCELYVDEQDTVRGDCPDCYEIMRCNSFESGSIACSTLSEAFPNAAFDLLTDRPSRHYRDYDVDHYNILRHTLTQPKPRKAKLFVVDGGKT